MRIFRKDIRCIENIISKENINMEYKIELFKYFLIKLDFILKSRAENKKEKMISTFNNIIRKKGEIHIFRDGDLNNTYVEIIKKIKIELLKNENKNNMNIKRINNIFLHETYRLKVKKERRNIKQKICRG